MICQKILQEAEKLVGGDRQEDYGDKLKNHENIARLWSACLLYTSPSPRDLSTSRMPSSA